MNNLSIILGEYDYGFSNKIFHSEHLILQSNPNAKNNWCFKVFLGDYLDDMCRISMIEPKYINAEGETLILTEELISEMISWLNKKCDFDNTISYWDYLIESWNLIMDEENQIPID